MNTDPFPVPQQQQKRPKILSKLHKNTKALTISPPVTNLHSQQKFLIRTPEQFCQYDTEVEISSPIQTRVLHPTLLNKSSIHCVNFSDCYLTQVPDLQPKIQKLQISINMLQNFPLGLPNLKEINISSNKIRRLPDDLQQKLPCLRIIKANNNNIGVIPYLSQIRHLELRSNPIKLISARLPQSRLQYLDFDWIPYLVNTIFYYTNAKHDLNDQQEILYAIYDLIDKTTKLNLNSVPTTAQTINLSEQSMIINSNKNANVNEDIINKQFVQFDMLFQCSRNNGLTIQFLLHRAIKNGSDFFIDFLRFWHGGINYNAMQYANRPILQQILENKYQKALQLFQIRKSNLSQPQTYITNLLLSCRYNNIQFFNYLTKNGLKRHIIQQNSRLIVQTILKNFDQQLQSGEMLKKILQISSFNPTNNKFIFGLPDFDNRQGECLADGIIYILKDVQGIEKYFSFQNSLFENINYVGGSTVDAFKEPLLHFAMRMKKPQLVKRILQKYNMPFVKSMTGKAAKTIRGSMFSRKIVWKYEKKIIKNQFNTQHQEERVQKNQMRKSRFLDIFFSRHQKIETTNDLVCEQHEQVQKTDILEKVKSKQEQKDIILQEQDLGQQKQIIYQKQRTKKLNNSPFKSLSKQKKTCPLDTNFSNESHTMRSPNSKMINLHPKIDNLTLYETFHKSQLSAYTKDYEIVNSNNKAKVNSISFYSPFYICRDVDLKQDHEAEFYEVIKNTPRQQNQKSKEVENYNQCMNSCMNMNQQINIVN